MSEMDFSKFGAALNKVSSRMDKDLVSAVTTKLNFSKRISKGLMYNATKLIARQVSRDASPHTIPHKLSIIGCLRRLDEKRDGVNHDLAVFVLHIFSFLPDTTDGCGLTGQLCQCCSKICTLPIPVMLFEKIICCGCERFYCPDCAETQEFEVRCDACPKVGCSRCCFPVDEYVTPNCQDIMSMSKWSAQLLFGHCGLCDATHCRDHMQDGLCSCDVTYCLQCYTNHRCNKVPFPKDGSHYYDDKKNNGQDNKANGEETIKGETKGETKGEIKGETKGETKGEIKGELNKVDKSKSLVDESLSLEIIMENTKQFLEITSSKVPDSMIQRLYLEIPTQSGHRQAMSLDMLVPIILSHYSKLRDTWESFEDAETQTLMEIKDVMSQWIAENPLDGMPWMEEGALHREEEQRKAVEQIKEQADTAAKNKQWEIACAKYNDAIETLQKNESADQILCSKLHANQSFTKLNLNIYQGDEGAIFHAQQAVYFNPSWGKAHYRLGAALQASGYLLLAQAAYTEALAVKEPYKNKSFRKLLQELILSRNYKSLVLIHDNPAHEQRPLKYKTCKMMHAQPAEDEDPYNAIAAMNDIQTELLINLRAGKVLDVDTCKLKPELERQQDTILEMMCIDCALYPHMTAIQCPGTRAWICKRARAGLVMKNSGYFSQFPGITEEDQKSFYKKKKNEEHEKDVYNGSFDIYQILMDPTIDSGTTHEKYWECCKYNAGSHGCQSQSNNVCEHKGSLHHTIQLRKRRSFSNDPEAPCSSLYFESRALEDCMNGDTFTKISCTFLIGLTRWVVVSGCMDTDPRVGFALKSQPFEVPGEEFQKISAFEWRAKDAVLIDYSKYIHRPLWIFTFGEWLSWYFLNDPNVQVKEENMEFDLPRDIFYGAVAEYDDEQEYDMLPDR